MISRVLYIIDKFKRKLMSNEQYMNRLRKDGIRIGEKCSIHKSVNFGSEPWLIKIGNHTRITKGVQFITHDGGLWTLRELRLVGQEDVKYGAIHIGNNCNISWDVIIMPGVRIGNNVIVAAGALVTKSIPDNSVWGGVPAHHIETITEYAEKVKVNCVPTNSMSRDEKRKYLQANRPELFI